MKADDIISFLDLLDLDEELVDCRLKSIMERKSYTKQHLTNAIHLLNYKHLLNVKDSDECDDDYEFEFIGRLMGNVTEENIDAICKVINMILMLSPSTIISKSEYLLQQLLSVSFEKEDINNEENLLSLLSCLKMCDSVIDTVLKLGEKLSLPFLNVPLENIVRSQNESLKKHFFTKTVPLFFDGVSGYNILDRIWECAKEGSKVVALKVLCVLSNYFLPLLNDDGIILYESNIVTHTEFWEIILYGLSINDPVVRKLSIYLLKRTIDYLHLKNIELKITTPEVKMFWDTKIKNNLRTKWNNFFILIDSLEEKQSNIVLPSLYLFTEIEDLGQCWEHCAYNIGLQHDNLQIKTTCINYRLKRKIINTGEASMLLEALNDMNIFDNETDCSTVKESLNGALNDSSTFICICKAIPKIKWSPVPLYHFSTVLAQIKPQNLTSDKEELFEIMCNLSKVPCNNIVIRKAFYTNLSSVIANCCAELSWRNILYLFNQINSVLSSNTRKSEDTKCNFVEHSLNKSDDGSLFCFIKEKLDVPDKNLFFKELKGSHSNVDFLCLYLNGHENDISYFMDLLKVMLDDIQKCDAESKFNCCSDVIFLCYLFKETRDNIPLVHNHIKDNIDVLLNYVIDILNMHINDYVLDDLLLMLDGFQEVYNMHDCPNTCMKLYKHSINLLKDSVDINKNIFIIYLLQVIHDSESKISSKLDIDVCEFIKILNKINNIHIKDGNGRLRNLFSTKACLLIYHIVQTKKIVGYRDILEYIINSLESGDRDSIKYILRITNIILPAILNSTDFSISNFLRQMWNEIEAIKTNKEYLYCMEGFVKLITNEALLKEAMYNNEVLSYCNKIIDYAMVKSMPLYYLVDELGKHNALEYGHMVYLFSEILLAVAVPRKDNRITENLIVEISKQYNLRSVEDGVFTTFHIQYKTLQVLSKISDTKTLEVIASIIIKKIDATFKNKQRYHKNSTLHRILQTALQHFLYLFLKCRSNYIEEVFNWCIDFLGKIPHQESTKLYLEWYICLWFYYKNIKVPDAMEMLSTKDIPITSQFMILYWLIKHKILIGKCEETEFKLVLDILLENTMGPTYSIRLYAQYLIQKLHDLIKLNNTIDLTGYEQAIKVVNKTLHEASKLKEKSFERLLNDYFVHNFDIIKDLKPNTIYYCTFEQNNEKIDEDFAKEIFKDMEENLKGSDWFFEEWLSLNTKEIKLQKFVKQKNFDLKDTEQIDGGNIQKKYIPWNNMSDIDIVGVKKLDNKSDLIVVASLIDKLPNLGGMARTSEIFAVNTYVIDSLRHLQDKQFQGLSVSAERWVNVIEIRPGKPLKDYLLSMKTEGYTIVAAEQTSNSVSLQTFKFPKKTLLLLGNEKAGIPCDLLPYMDVCVEVPQRGVLRSLNVHVTAAIFIWEYTRQHT